MTLLNSHTHTYTHRRARTCLCIYKERVDQITYEESVMVSRIKFPRIVHITLVYREKVTIHNI